MIGSYPLYALKPFVRVVVKLAGGRRQTMWAEKLRDGVYRQVDLQGDSDYGGKLRFFFGVPRDIVREQPARLNQKYGELEVVSPGWEDLQA